MEEVEKLVVLDEAALREAQEVAAANDVQLITLPAKGFEPVSTITVLLIGSSLAVGTVSFLLDKRKGGQVIDLRPGAPKALYRTTDVIYGLVVIVAVDGSVTVEVKEPKGAYGITIDALRHMTSDLKEATVDLVASLARQALGDKVRISTQPAEVSP